MEIVKIIEGAFSELGSPAQTLAARTNFPTLEQQDAMWFRGRRWRTLTLRDWEQHRHAFANFTAEAFRYFLPSILALSAPRPERWFWPVDYFLERLDCEPRPEGWDRWLTTRMLGMGPPQYAAIRYWIAHFARCGTIPYERSLGRCMHNVLLLELQTSRYKNNVRRRPGTTQPAPLEAARAPGASPVPARPSMEPGGDIAMEGDMHADF